MGTTLCSSVSAERYEADQEAAEEAACYGTAEKNGFTTEQADECDDFSVGCKDCPFRIEEV